MENLLDRTGPAARRETPALPEKRPKSTANPRDRQQDL
jgi:hypothetical protein